LAKEGLVTIRFSYECKNPKKFPKAHLLDVSYLAWMVNGAEAVLEAALAGPNREKFKYWFGDFGSSQEAKFQHSQLKTRDMLEHARSNGFIFNQLSETTLAKTDQSRAALELGLGTYMSLGIYSLGELVATLIHELSHKTPGLMTKDISTGKTDLEGNAERAYKGEAVALAVKKPDDAYANAENWGYYIASYHSEAGFTSNFEHTKNRKDIESKIIPGSVSERRGEHWGGSVWIAHEGKGCVPHYDPTVNPIIRFNVNCDAVVYDLANTPLGKPGAASSTGSVPVKTVTHVDKAVSSDGPHKCPNCGRGFLKITEKSVHAMSCKG
jgi:hypothetical protein